jgi:hypothetical protein
MRTPNDFDPGRDALTLGRFRLTPAGLTAEGEPDRSEWEECGRLLRSLEKGVQWAIGDWVRYGRDRSWGDIAEIAPVVGVAEQTLKDNSWVASVFNLSRRRDKLPFTHHKDIAALPRERQDELLDWCEETVPETGRPRTRAELRKRVRELRSHDPEAWSYLEAASRVRRFLESQRLTWPEDQRPAFPDFLRLVADDLADVYGPSPGSSDRRPA